MKIGIFGGSFDPIHTEHKALALAAVAGLGLDRLIVVPAGIPPHKQGKRLASAEDRLEMCRLAFADVPQAEISDYEVNKAGTSYSYLTVRHFRDLYPQAELFFLVGTDMYLDFFSWKNPDSLLSDATLAVCRRNEGTEAFAERQATFFARFKKRFVTVPYNGKAISSTDIRTRAALGLPIDEKTPSAVARYVQERGLYRSESVERGLAMENPARAAHSRRVCMFAVERAARFHVPEEKAFLASALHDVAKNISPDDERLSGFVPPKDVPMSVFHQYAGAYVLEKHFGITDEDILNAVRYHTSGRPGMSDLEKLVFLSDLLEEGRMYPEVELLRASLDDGLDRCMALCLKHLIAHLEDQQADIYPLTLEAYEYYRKGE